MSFKGPIKPKKNSTPNTVPYISTDFAEAFKVFSGEIICNSFDGRLWIRKEIDFSQKGLTLYNYEQIGGPYVITEKTGGHTLAPEDTGRIIEMNVSSPSRITIPSYTGSNGVPFIKGTEIKIVLTNSGPVSITGAPGVTLNSKSGFNLSSQWGMASLIKRDVNSWVITGDVS